MSKKLDFSEGLIAIYKMAAMLDIWDKGDEAKALFAIAAGDVDALKALSFNKEQYESLYKSVKAAMLDEKTPIETRAAVTQIYADTLHKAGVDVSIKGVKVVHDRPEADVHAAGTNLEKLEGNTEKEMEKKTYPMFLSQQSKINIKDRSGVYQAMTGESAKFNKVDPYKGLNKLYKESPNFVDTQKAHDESGVLIVPSYMNNGVMYRDDITHLMMENIARKLPTGLSVYVGGVPIKHEDLNNIGNAAIKLNLKNDIDGSMKAASIIYTYLLEKFAKVDKSMQKRAYDGTMGRESSRVTRETVYPIRPDSHMLQVAHPPSAVTIDPRSLEGIIMRADVKHNVIEDAATSIPKCAMDLKVEYIRILESGSIADALKFKKAAKDIYNVDCGDLDDSVIEKAHSGPSPAIEGRKVPNIKEQQEIDKQKATTTPTGAVSDEPVKFAYIDIGDLTSRFIAARKDDKKPEISVLLPKGTTDPEVKEDYPLSGGEDEIPGLDEVSVMPVDTLSEPPIEADTNVTVNFSETGDGVKVSLSGNVVKDFEDMAAAKAWAAQVEEALQANLGGAKAAGLKLTDVLHIAHLHNGLLDYMKRIATFSTNIQNMLDITDDIA